MIEKSQLKPFWFLLLQQQWLFCWHPEEGHHKKHTFHTHQCYESKLTFMPHGYTSLVLQYKHIYILMWYTSRERETSIIILSCKTFWHFGEWVSFENIHLKFCCGKMLKYNNWILKHSPNLAKKNNATLTKLSHKVQWAKLNRSWP